MASIKRDLRTIREAATEFGIRDCTIRQWISRRLLWSTKVGGKVFLDRKDLDRLIREGERPSVDQMLERVLPKR